MRPRLIAFAIAIALVGGALFVRSQTRSDPASNGDTTTTRGQQGGGTEALIVCATEAERLCTETAPVFNGLDKDRRKNGQVRIALRDAPRAAQDIGQGSLQPAAWIPTSRAWVDRANELAKVRIGADIILNGGDNPPVPIATSPFVVAMWSDRADVLKTTCNGVVTLTCLRGAADKKGWVDIGGPQAWGPVKVTHADPATSGEGELAVAGLAYDFIRVRELTVADVENPAVEQFIDGFERAQLITVSGLAASGPAVAAAVIAPEASAFAVLEGSKSRNQGKGLALFYPDRMAVADYPFALVEQTGTARQRDVAIAYRNFLLSDAGAKLVNNLGYRPGSGTFPDPSPPPLPVLTPDRFAPVPSIEVLDRLREKAKR